MLNWLLTNKTRREQMSKFAKNLVKAGITFCIFLLMTEGLSNCCSSGDTFQNFEEQREKEYVQPQQARHYIGKNISVQGHIVQVSRSEGGDVFFNFEKGYPHQPFAAVIFAKNVPNFGYLYQYWGNTVKVTGTVEEYEGRPEIVLQHNEQIKVVRQTEGRPYYECIIGSSQQYVYYNLHCGDRYPRICTILNADIAPREGIERVMVCRNSGIIRHPIEIENPNEIVLLGNNLFFLDSLRIKQIQKVSIGHSKKTGQAYLDVEFARSKRDKIYISSLENQKRFGLSPELVTRYNLFSFGWDDSLQKLTPGINCRWHHCTIDPEDNYQCGAYGDCHRGCCYPD